jgi:hypothetical protein
LANKSALVRSEAEIGRDFFLFEILGGQAKKRKPSSEAKKLAECTASGGLCEESKESKVNATIKTHQVCTVSAGGRMERRSAKPIEGKSPAARRRQPIRPKTCRCTTSGGLCKESKESKVNVTIKTHQVCTVSDGSRMERRSAKPIEGKSPPARQRRPSRQKTCRVHRIGRPLQGE